MVTFRTICVLTTAVTAAALRAAPRPATRVASARAAPAAAPPAAPPAPPAAAARVKLPRLEADAFRHPLDKDLTTLVRGTPLALLETAVKRTATPPLEQMLRLDNLATGLKVTNKQFPELYASFQDAVAVLGGLEKEPELFVKSDPRPNAYTLAVQGGAPFVVVTSALVDNFSPAETQAVLGHELGHLVCEHSLWFSLGSIGSAFLPPLPGVSAASEAALQSWRRAAEFSCDRAALLVAQDAAVANGALVKLASGSTRDVDVEEFLAQARESFRRADIPRTGRGDAAAVTWIFRGDEPPQRRGCHVDIPWRRIAATPRTFRGDRRAPQGTTPLWNHRAASSRWPCGRLLLTPRTRCPSAASRSSTSSRRVSSTRTSSRAGSRWTETDVVLPRALVYSCFVVILSWSCHRLCRPRGVRAADEVVAATPQRLARRRRGVLTPRRWSRRTSRRP